MPIGGSELKPTIAVIPFTAQTAAPNATQFRVKYWPRKSLRRGRNASCPSPLLESSTLLIAVWLLPVAGQLPEQGNPLGSHLNVAASFEVFEQAADHFAGGANSAGNFLVRDGFQRDTCV